MKKTGIRAQYIRITSIVMTLSIVMGLTAYFYFQNSWTTLAKEQKLSLEKSEAMDHLSSSVNQVFFRARGYYSFQIENELNLAYREISNVYKAIETLRTIKLTNDERELIDKVEDFLINYQTTTLPNALSLVENDDYEGLRKLSLDGSNASVNQLITYSKQYKDDVHNELHSLSDETMKKFSFFSLFILIFAALLLAILTFMIWRVINQFIVPIEKMKSAADKYQDGKDIAFEPINREDEIGVLSNSFARLITTIQSKSEAMTAQNEELLMQQDELYKNQTIMEKALSEARYSKLRLERYNGLNHKISFTLDKKELVDLVLAYFDDLYTIDIGLLWLPESDQHALKGLSESMFEEFKTEQLLYIQLRLEKEPYFLLKRESTYGKGISATESYTYDYIAGIKRNNNEHSTLLIISRIGRPFSNEDMHDIYGLLNRVAQAVDRIEQYEAINRERTLNQNILDNVNEGIQFVSNTGGENKYNHSLFQLIGLPAEHLDTDWTQSKWKNYLLNITNDDGHLKSFIECSLESTTESGSETSYTIQGELLQVMNVYSVPVMLDGEKAGTIFVHRDITKEHEIDRMKTELVSTVSHELRTPLSSVLGFSELLLSRKLEPERQRKYLLTIQKEAKRLTNLVNDFLDLQRMEYGKQEYHPTQIRITDIANETINSFQISPLHSITIIDESNNAVVNADSDRIQQVFTNLLSNALKFSPDGGPITIKIAIEKDHLVIAIEDKGIGIPKNSLSNMFEKFHRFDSGYSSKIGGTGLGLPICKEIIKNHNGDIWIDSVEGVGTMVSFSLPLQLILPSETQSLTDQLTIMIVEDDTSIALLLAEELKEAGFSVNHQSDVQIAFNISKETLPACIVIDILLGSELTGWDLVKLLKEEPLTEHIPIIISSALDMNKEFVTAFNIEHYMTKPYPPNKLSETVFNVLHLNDGRILYPSPLV